MAKKEKTPQQRGRAAKEKGKRGEREAVHLLRELYPDAERDWQFRVGEAADIKNTPWWVEVRRRKGSFLSSRWLQETKDASDGRPALLMMRNDHQPEWIVTLYWEDFIKILKVFHANGGTLT